MQHHGNESGNQGEKQVAWRASLGNQISGAVHVTEHDHEIGVGAGSDNEKPLDIAEVIQEDRPKEKKTLEREFPAKRKLKEGSKNFDAQSKEPNLQMESEQQTFEEKQKATGFLNQIKQKLEEGGNKVLNFIGSRDLAANDGDGQADLEKEPVQARKQHVGAPAVQNPLQESSKETERAKMEFVNALSKLSLAGLDQQMDAETAFKKGTELVNFVLKKSEEVRSRNFELSTADQQAKSQFLEVYFSEFNSPVDPEQLSIAQAFELATEFILKARPENDSLIEYESSAELEYLTQTTTDFLGRRQAEIDRFREIWPKGRRPDRADFTQLRQTLEGSKLFDFVPGNENILPTLLVMYKLEKELKDRQQRKSLKEGVQVLDAFERIVGGLEHELATALGKEPLEVSLLKTQAESALTIHSAVQMKAEIDAKEKQTKILTDNLAATVKALETSQQTVLELTKELSALQAQFKLLSDNGHSQQRELEHFKQLLTVEKAKCSEFENSKRHLEQDNENMKLEICSLADKITRLEEIKEQQLHFLDLKERQLTDYKVRESLYSQRAENQWDKTGISSSRIDHPTNIYDDASMSFVRGPKDASSAGQEEQKDALRKSSNQELLMLIQTFKTLKEEYTKQVTEGTQRLKEAKIDKSNHFIDLNEKIQALESELKCKNATDRANHSKTRIHTLKEAFPYLIIGVLIIVILRLAAPV